MSKNATPATKCVPHPETGLCVTKGHGGGKKGRHKIGDDGYCKVGRRTIKIAQQRAKTTTECPACDKGRLSDGKGFVPDPPVMQEKRNAFLASMLMTLGISVTTEVCDSCAEHHNAEIKGLFVSNEKLRASAMKFIESFINGAQIKHKREKRGNKIINWCDHCDMLIMPENMQDSRGVVRGESAICTCKRCFDYGKIGNGDLPEITFRQALDQALAARRQRMKREEAQRRGESVDAVEQTVNVQPDEDRDAASERGNGNRQRRRRGPRFTDIKDIAEAIRKGGHGVRSSKYEQASGKTICTVHMNNPELCQCDDGRDDWSIMGGIEANDHAFGFGQTCVQILASRGIQMDGIYMDLFLKLQAERSPRRQQRRRRQQGNHTDQVEFVNPTSRAGGRTSRAAQRKVAERRARNAKAQAKLDKQVETLNQRIEAEQVRLNDLLMVLKRADADLLRGEQMLAAATNGDREAAERIIADSSVLIELFTADKESIEQGMQILRDRLQALLEGGASQFIEKPTRKAKNKGNEAQA